MYLCVCTYTFMTNYITSNGVYSIRRPKSHTQMYYATIHSDQIECNGIISMLQPILADNKT